MLYVTAAYPLGKNLPKGGIKLYKKWLNSEVITVVFGVSDNNGNGYLVELPKVKFREGSVNGIQKDQDVMLSLPFDAFYDKAANTGVRIYKA